MHFPNLLTCQELRHPRLFCPSQAKMTDITNAKAGARHSFHSLSHTRMLVMSIVRKTYHLTLLASQLKFSVLLEVIAANRVELAPSPTRVLVLCLNLQGHPVFLLETQELRNR